MAGYLTRPGGVAPGMGDRLSGSRAGALGLGAASVAPRPRGFCVVPARAF